MAEILWIGGWASDLACWRGALESLYPARAHRFLDAHALLEGSAILEAEAARLPPGSCLAAWSLGSLLVHRALAEGWRPDCRLLSISPIFDFCAESGPWPRAAVQRMIRRLPRERERVLGEFRAAARGDSALPEGWVRSWEERARTYSDAVLTRGLEALAGIHLDPGMDFPAGHRFLASAQDPLSPAPRGTAGDPRWTSYPRGHLPFLDFPHLVGPLLPAAGSP